MDELILKFAGTSQLWFWGMVGALGLGAFLFGLSLVPKERKVELIGYRATDRKEGLAENRFLAAIWPIVELGARYTSGFAWPDWRKKMGEVLRDAGQPLGLDVDEAFGLMFAAIVVGCAASFVISHLQGFSGFGMYIMAVGIGGAMPFMWLNDQAKERFKSINRGLPQAIDLIVMAMGAGLDFVGALGQVCERWSDKKDPVCRELNRMLHELSLGKTRREALEDLAVRAPTELVRTFVANVVQAEQRGTPLIEILAIQAEVARTRRFQTAERIAGRAGVMVLFPLVLIFASVLLVLFGGLIVKGVRGTLTS